MAPSTIRKSPAIYESLNGQASTSLSTFTSQIDIPSTFELTQLVAALRERRTLITRRRRNLKSDESNVLDEATSSRAFDGNVSLSVILDNLEKHVQTTLATSSPTTSKVSLAPPLPSKSRSAQAASPSPRTAQPSASPAPSSIGQSTSSQQGGSSRTKIKIKRDPDRERERSESVIETASTSAAGANVTGSAASIRQSPTFEADWDEEAPTRPSRTYQHKRKRQRNSQTRDQADYSQSEIGSPAPASSQRTSPHGESSWDARPFGSSGLQSNGTGSTQPTIKLKLNPTTHTVPVRNDVLNPSIRGPSTLRGREDFPTIPMTPMQASQAAMWELPKRTPETFIPKKPISKPIRLYPTRPDEVDVDFAKMDWRERDKERDRLEAVAAAAASVNGPGPGQAVIKEGTAASRARDRKQDQVAHHTFQQWTDGWFRTLTEEDLAWFSSKSDELDAFQFPSLGRHYSEVWEEEEANGVLIPTTYLSTGPALGTSTSTMIAPALTNVNGGTTRQSISGAAANNANGRIVSTVRPPVSILNGEIPKFDPRNLKDDHLYGGSSEDVHSGPFTERLLAALLPLPPPTSTSGPLDTITNGIDTMGPSSNTVQMNGYHQSSSASGQSTGRSQDMAEFEERLRRELKAIDIIGNEEIDWSDRADDEISSTLRTIQRLLRKQIRINELRKTRLFQIALDRMAYQDYIGCLNSVEREIESGWMKRQSQIKKSMQAQKKKKGHNNNSGSSSAAPNNSNAFNGIVAAVAASDGQNIASPATPGGAPGSTGMAPSSSSMGNPTLDRGGGPMPPQFSDSLLSAMEKRKRLKFAFEPLFADKPLANYTPKGDESIYRDLDFS